MSLESFRRALDVRHREAAACARARLSGETRDEAWLDELDAELFSRDAIAAAASQWVTLMTAPTNEVLASARSRLAIVLEEGILSRLRPLDRAIESARARKRREEAEGLVVERRRLLQEEGSRPLATSGSGASKTARTLAAESRGETAETLEASARRLLAESAAIAEQTLMLAGKPSPDGRAQPGQGMAGAVPSSSPAGRVARVLKSWCGPGPELSAALVSPALRELGTGLGLDLRGLTLTTVRAPEAPTVLEVDPPQDVLLALSSGEDFDSFEGALDAWGESLAPCMRAHSLPEEHRLHVDRLLGRAIGTLAASLTPEHAHLRREPVPARRRALAREIVSARLSAALFLDRDRLLSGSGAGEDGARAAIEEASLGQARLPEVEAVREPIFEALDRFRGHLLAPHLRERLRTRFGNLWYRESGAGRLLREACEPGGSLLAAEILAGLSIAVPSAESLVDSWRDEIKRLR